MKQRLKEVSEIVASANDQFYEKNKAFDTVIGIMDKTLRQQGMNADAITVDCVPLNKKIVFLLHDEKPNMIDIALGNKEGDITSSFEQSFSEFSVNTVVGLLVEFFSKK